MPERDNFTGAVIDLEVGHHRVAAWVLLDVLDPLRRGVLPADSSLRFFLEAVLIAVLDASSAPITAVFVGREALDDGIWPVRERRTVPVEALDFPISLRARGSQIRLSHGEVSLPTAISSAEYRSIGVTGTLYPASALPAIAAALRGLPIPDPDGRSREQLLGMLADGDLRRSPHRDRLFTLLPELRSEEPYAQLSRRHGLDPARLLG